MKLGYKKQYLLEMLKADQFSAEVKSAVRWALWCINNPETPQVVTKPPGVPFWRYVEYADDGCTIYQCLSCKEKWEARTAPGWMEYHKLDGDLGPKDEPIYHPVFKYCPYCGIEWQGPIRRDDDNEFMLGPKRLARRNRNFEVRKQFTPDWWMVIQSREIWANRDEPEKWLDVCKFSPYRHSPQMVMDEVDERRERDAENQNPFMTREFRATTRSQEEMKELYPIAWQELDERR